MWRIALKSHGGALYSQAVTSNNGGSPTFSSAAGGSATGARAGAAGTAGENSPGGGEISSTMA
ncbi:MAG: hypothetical protein WD971_10560, partial [Pirellulales bacterium]